MTPVLVTLRSLGLGDFLTGLPALRGLERAFPDHHRMLACPIGLTPLVRAAGLGVEVVHTRGLAGLTGVPRRADVAVNLHGRGPQSHLALLDLAPGRLLAFANRGVPDDGPAWDPDEHEMQRWCRLLASYGIPADPADHLITGVVPNTATQGSTVVHPGAKDAARRWPLERWAQVVRSERRAGRRVVITGNPDEVTLAVELAERSDIPPSDVWAGRTDLEALGGLVSAAELVLCGDTGVAHLATALGVPLVTLFGPTPPSRWGPPPAPWRRVLWSGRTGDPHATRPDPGLLEIGADDVIDEVARLRSSLLRPPA